jgi:3-dehydroquinate dehydratase/shikimate dehydrogenase
MAIVVSILADDFDRLARLAVRQVPLADLVEVRLDRIGHPGEDALRRLARECGRPLIVTCPRPDAGGEFGGTLDEELGLYADAARCGARFVGVDWTHSLDLGEVQAPCHRIVTAHVPEGTPDDLDAVRETVQGVQYEGDVTKIVTHARSTADGMRLLQWLATTKGIVSFCSGEAGSFTRLLAPVFGSPFTYCAPAPLPGEPPLAPSAPGQIAVGDLLAQLPPSGISQETAVLGVVGRPVGHSLSPWVQGMALKAAHLDAVYAAFEPEDLASFLALADAPNYRAFAVTAPFKEEAFRLAEAVDEGSRRARAVNTLLRTETGWRGANTDVSAARATLEQAFTVHGREPGRVAALADARVLVLGTGGAARAAAWAVTGVHGRVTVAGRDPEKARRVAEELECDWVRWDDVPSVEYDALVHATPVGSRTSEGELAMPVDWIRPGTVVLDAVYRPLRTALLMEARRRGCTAVPGGEWFLRQAVAQFRLQTNQEADEAFMRSTLEHTLGAEG